MKYKYSQLEGKYSMDGYFTFNEIMLIWPEPIDGALIAINLVNSMETAWKIPKTGIPKIKNNKLYRFIGHDLECRELYGGSIIWCKNLYPSQGGTFTNEYCIYIDRNEWVFSDYEGKEAFRVLRSKENEKEFVDNNLIIRTSYILDEFCGYHPYLKFFTLKGEAKGVIVPSKLANFRIGNVTLPEKVGFVSTGWGPSTLQIHGNLATFALGQKWEIAFCCANIDTGEFVWFSEYPITRGYQVLNDNLYFIYDESLIVLDLYTGMVKRQVPIQYHPEMDFTMKFWGATVFTIKAGYIYLTHRGRRAIMIINIETGQVEWFDVFREGDTYYMGGYSVSPRPLVLGNRIFAGDSDKVLHVWERVE